MPKTKYYIENLSSIFKRIDSGELHIPAFQRNFVWDKQQTLQLFDSIYNGLPIGTLLFWQSHEEKFAFSEDDFTNQPSTEEQLSYMYVIDGTQRLKVLYNCLHRKNKHPDSRFNIGFNLENEVFMYLDGASISEDIIVLSSIFSYEDIIKYQINLASYDNSQTLVKNLNKLISTFVDYQIPIIVIDGATRDELITVFQRINTIGVSLSKEEILRARERYED